MDISQTCVNSYIYIRKINVISYTMSFAEDCIYDGEKYEELSMVPLNRSDSCEVCHCYVRIFRVANYKILFYTLLFYRMEKSFVQIFLSLALTWNVMRPNKSMSQKTVVHNALMVGKIFIINCMIKLTNNRTQTS